MKQFFNYKVILSLWLSCGLSYGAMAQQSDNAIAVASATVVQQIDVSKVADLAFHLVSPGVTKTITHQGATLVSAGTTTGSEGRGVFTVSAGAGTSVNLSYSVPTNLSDGGTNTLPVTFTSGRGTANDDNASTVVNIGTATTISSFPSNDVGGTNLIYVMLGGTVTPAVNQAAGTYTADVTLTATYN